MIQVGFPFPFANNCELNLCIIIRHIFYKITLLDKFAQFFIGLEKFNSSGPFNDSNLDIIPNYKIIPVTQKKKKKRKEKKREEFARAIIYP